MTTHSYASSPGGFMLETPLILRYFKRPRHSSFSVLNTLYMLPSRVTSGIKKFYKEMKEAAREELSDNTNSGTGDSAY